METMAERKQGRESKARRLVLVPCPFQGHINPMLQLASILHHRGFSITVAHTLYNSPNPSNHPDFRFISIPDGLSDRKINFEDAVSTIVLVNENCRDPLREILEKVDGEGSDVAAVIFDEMMFYAESVCQSLKIPSLILRTNNAATLVARFAFLNLAEEGKIPVPDSKMNELVPTLEPFRFKDLPYPVHSAAAGNFFELMKNMSDLKKSAFIINTCEFLEHRELMQLKQLRQVPIFTIGPLHRLVPPTAASYGSSLLEEDNNCIDWLNTQETKSVLYVSLGSIASMEESEFEEMAWGLVNSNHPFLWVIRPDSTGKSSTKELENIIRGRGLIVDWAPQRKVLAHKAVGWFWSHCGWNSTLESISEGVPMICRPYFGDQTVCARLVSKVWETGLTYEEERLERNEVEKIVKRVMVGKEGKEMRQRAKELKEKMEATVADDGFANNSLNQLVELIMSF